MSSGRTPSTEVPIMKAMSSLAACLLLLLATGCMTAAQHQQSLPSSREPAMTVGVVQREIRKGMSAAEVATALGSPNIVTKDAQGDETWVYDKIATEASYSRSSGGTGLLVSLLGVAEQGAGASRSSERTLTVVIKFDRAKRVKEFSYHSSRF